MGRLEAGEGGSNMAKKRIGADMVMIRTFEQFANSGLDPTRRRG